jgi:L-ascorbate metabolism protein UlaG (beta-lactamase superfamily)
LPLNKAASDHFDGKRFFNPGQAPARHRLIQILKWRFGGERRAWSPLPLDPGHPPPPAGVAPGTAALTFIGHSSFLLQLPGITILTDPVFSDRCSPVSWAGPKRARPPGLALAKLPPIDLVLVSHNHYDHMDLPSLRHLASRGTPAVIGTVGNEPILRRAGFGRVTTLDWWESTTTGPFRITATPARHFSRRGLLDGNRSLWAGFSVASPDGQVLFAGDSGAGPHWTAIRERLGPPDLALIPIGAYEPRWLMAPVHMNPAEAIQAHHDLGARQSIGMHFGTFQLTDEPVDAPQRALADAGVAAFTTLGFGETRLFSLRS